MPNYRRDCPTDHHDLYQRGGDSKIPFDCLAPDPKVLFRRGCAHLELRDGICAVRDFSQALELKPGVAAVISKLKEAKRYYPRAFEGVG